MRPLALVLEGTVHDVAAHRPRLERLAVEGSIPFIVENADGSGDGGYARAGWVVDLFYWASNTEIPQERRAQILGLLLGYSADEIGDYTDWSAGSRYLRATGRCTPS